MATELGITGYEYGNTRLRARRARLLVGADLRELFASGSIDRMLGVLQGTAYGPDVEQAMVRSGPLQRLDVAVRCNLARSLGDLRRFYGGRAANGVDLMLGRWDLRNLVSVVRSTARATGGVEPTALIVPVGVLDGAALAELARQPSVRAAIELMVAWDLPSRATARRLLGTWSPDGAPGDPAALEEVLVAAWAESVADSIVDWDGTDLATVLRSEIDALNLLAVLRRRADADPAAPGGATGRAGPPLLGGALGTVVLDAVARAADPADAVALLADTRLPAGWLEALESWAASPDLGELTARIDRAVARAAVDRFGLGDPLGISIPVAYVWAKESEARNVRMIGRALVHGLDWLDVEQELFPW